MNGRIEKIRVTGPLGEHVEAAYGIIDESRTAIIKCRLLPELHW